MKTRTIMSAAVAAAAMALSATAFAAGDAAAGSSGPSAGNASAGKQKITMCAGCHGIPGYKTAFPSVYNVPKLGGQNAGYIVKALKGYKSGERSHPTMRAIAADLSDQDMADLAAYYSADNAKTAAK